MWRLKSFWQSQDCAGVLPPRRDNQVFEEKILFVHGRDELLLTIAQSKADAKNAISLFYGKDYALFVFCGDVARLATILKVIDDDEKGR